MVESMVALLRGQTYANSSDVELYLKNYQGLKYKMERVDPALIPEEAIKVNEKKLEAMIKSFTEETDKDFAVNSQFVHMFAWSMHFATVCKFSRNVKFIEDKLEEGVKRKAFLQEQKRRYAGCLEDLEMFELAAIQEERDMLETLLADIKDNAAGREAEMCKVQ
jgi:hypothetical protein